MFEASGDANNPNYQTGNNASPTKLYSKPSVIIDNSQWSVKNDAPTLLPLRTDQEERRSSMDIETTSTAFSGFNYPEVSPRGTVQVSSQRAGVLLTQVNADVEPGVLHPQVNLPMEQLLQESKLEEEKHLNAHKSLSDEESTTRDVENGTAGDKSLPDLALLLVRNSAILRKRGIYFFATCWIALIIIFSQVPTLESKTVGNVKVYDILIFAFVSCFGYPISDFIIGESSGLIETKLIDVKLELFTKFLYLYISVIQQITIALWLIIELITFILTFYAINESRAYYWVTRVLSSWIILTIMIIISRLISKYVTSQFYEKQILLKVNNSLWKETIMWKLAPRTSQTLSSSNKHVYSYAKDEGEVSANFLMQQSMFLYAQQHMRASYGKIFSYYATIHNANENVKAKAEITTVRAATLLGAAIYYNILHDKQVTTQVDPGILPKEYSSSIFSVKRTNSKLSNEDSSFNSSQEQRTPDSTKRFRFFSRRKSFSKEQAPSPVSSSPSAGKVNSTGLKSCIVKEDVKRLLKRKFPKYAFSYDDIWKIFDPHGRGYANLEHAQNAMKQIFVERENIATNLTDHLTVIRQLQSIMDLVFVITSVFCMVPLFASNVLEIWFAFTSILAVFAIFTGSYLQTLFINIIFIFIMHPYDVGDVILVGSDKVKYEVTRIHINSTELKQWNGMTSHFPTAWLSHQSNLVNCSRSGFHWEEFIVVFDMACYSDKMMTKLNSAIQAAVRRDSDLLSGEFQLVIRRPLDKLKLQLILWVEFNFSYADLTKVLDVSHKVMVSFVKALNSCDIKYSGVGLGVVSAAKGTAMSGLSINLTSPNSDIKME